MLGRRRDVEPFIEDMSMARNRRRRKSSRGFSDICRMAPRSKSVKLRGDNGFECAIITYGAALQSIFAPDRAGHLADVGPGPR